MPERTKSDDKAFIILHKTSHNPGPRPLDRLLTARSRVRTLSIIPFLTAHARVRTLAIILALISSCFILNGARQGTYPGHYFILNGARQGKCQGKKSTRVRTLACILLN